MSWKELPDAELRVSLAALHKHGSQAKAAAALGITRSAMQHRLRSISSRGITEMPAIEFPQSLTEGEDGEPIDELLDRLERNYERAKRNADARKWFEIKVTEDRPIGLLFVGDPHVDDNGCSWPLLRKHAGICRDTEGMYAINIGDSTNCWGGRLIKKYADQDASVHTARRLVEWLLLESGFRWLVWLHGNHEHMGDGAPLLREMNRRYGTTRVPMFDWEARFVLKFANGSEFRINAAHDFPSDSMWNPNHGPLKAAKFGDRLDVVACGHKHNWATTQWENAEQGTAPVLVRARGYKHLDDYARRIGKTEQDEGQSVLVVLDPNSETIAGRSQSFVDIKKGAAYLAMLRAMA